jgi:DNA invertase Pin-like site-specific DNA recombinase
MSRRLINRGTAAEMERRFIRDRRQAGIEAAKAKGVYKGRKLSVPVVRMKAMHAEEHGPSAIAKALGRCSAGRR